MRRQWNKWMISGEHSFTTAGNMKVASLATVCEWVVKSWAEVKTEYIVKSFKKCSISNTMDGTEDGLLWQEDDEDVVTGQRSCNQPRRWHGDCQRNGHAFRGIRWWRVWWILNSKNLVHLLMAIKFLIFVSCRVHEQCTLSVSCHSWNHLTMYSICTVNTDSSYELLVFLVSIFKSLYLLYKPTPRFENQNLGLNSRLIHWDLW